jgi:hypothetical protein
MILLWVARPTEEYDGEASGAGCLSFKAFEPKGCR